MARKGVWLNQNYKIATPGTNICLYSYKFGTPTCYLAPTNNSTLYSETEN